MSRVAVVIVNYNTRDHLSACLAILNDEVELDILVVDNGSTDGSIDMVVRDYPDVIVCANATNTGYGGAANYAFSKCTAQYVLLLNSDTTVRTGSIAILRDYLDQHPQVALAGPRLEYPDGKLQHSCYPFPYPVDTFLEVSSLVRLVGRVPILRDRYLRTWPHLYSRDVPWVLGAALAIRRSAFEAIGGFDESYFMYYEEVDLCYRLRESGWEVHYVATATVVHAQGASTEQQRAAMLLQWFSSTLRFYRRHYSRPRQAALTVLITCVVAARLARDVVRLYGKHDQDGRRRVEEDITIWKRVLWGNSLGV